MISCYHNMLMDYILPSSTLSSMYCHFWLQQTLMAMILKNSMSDVTVALHFGGSRWVFFFNPVILFTVWLQFIIEGTMLLNVSMDFGEALHPTQLNLNQISGHRQETTSWLEKPHLPHDTCLHHHHLPSISSPSLPWLISSHLYHLHVVILRCTSIQHLACSPSAEHLRSTFNN